nr:LuxR C-terminal-related transcriptional regulator [Streptomyces sp. NBC_01001]
MHEADLSLLTEREREVLAALGDCQPNAVIASRFHITERTVKKHVASVFAKLEITSRTEAAIIAIFRNHAQRPQGVPSDTSAATGGVASSPSQHQPQGRTTVSASTLVRETEIAAGSVEAKAVSAYSSASIGAYVAATTAPARAIASIRTKVDKGLVRYDAWFLIFVAVVLGLGATIFAGLVVWCVVKQNKSFTGNWSFKNYGLQVSAECK